MLVLIIRQRHRAICFSLGLRFHRLRITSNICIFWVNIVPTSGSTNHLKIPSQNKILYNKETENSLAGSRTQFICTCKQLLDHCTIVPLQSVFGEVTLFFLNHFSLAQTLFEKISVSTYIKAISHYYFGFKGPIVNCRKSIKKAVLNLVKN